MTTQRFKYVLTLIGRNRFLDENLDDEDVTGPVGDLVTGLRSWLLARLGNGSWENGWYTGRLVAVNEDGTYDTYLAVATEDVVWFWDEEYTPRSTPTP